MAAINTSRIGTRNLGTTLSFCESSVPTGFSGSSPRTFTPNMKFMHTYHDDYWVIPSTPSFASPFETIHTFSGRNPSVTFGRITHVLSPNTFYEVGVSGFYSPRDLTESNNPGVPLYYDLDNDLQSGGGCCYAIFKQGRTELKAKVSHYANEWLGADHDFKFGVQHVIGNHSEHGGYQPGENYPGGVIYYDNGDGTPYYITTATNYNNGGEFRETGIFAEDVINVGNRLTVQAGIRFDRIRGISQDVADLAVTDIVALEFDEQGQVAGRGELFEWTNWGPRIGFNYKLDDDGRTVLRGNWGRFYRTAHYRGDFRHSSRTGFFDTVVLESRNKQVRYRGAHFRGRNKLWVRSECACSQD